MHLPLLVLVRLFVCPSGKTQLFLFKRNDVFVFLRGISGARQYGVRSSSPPGPRAQGLLNVLSPMATGTPFQYPRKLGRALDYCPIPCTVVRNDETNVFAALVHASIFAAHILESLHIFLHRRLCLLLADRVLPTRSPSYFPHVPRAISAGRQSSRAVRHDQAEDSRP